MVYSIVCVLKSGGAYGPDDVIKLRRGIIRHLKKDFKFYCLSDMELPYYISKIKLEHNFPGWWSKMELFKPYMGQFGDILFIDLDTVIVGDLEPVLKPLNKITLLRDFYRPKELGSGLMYIPKLRRYKIWEEWTKNPEMHMCKFRTGGDQAFLMQYWLNKADRFQELYYCNYILSYKADNVGEKLPKTAKIICFHGKPKPADVTHLPWMKENWI